MRFFVDDPVLEMPRGPHPRGRRFQGGRRCDLFESRGDKIARKDSYWKLEER
jgi:hypothetical protein